MRALSKHAERHARRRAYIDAQDARALRQERFAQRAAAIQIEQLDQLALLGYPTSFDEVTRDVVETTLRLAIRSMLEEGAR